MFFHSVAVIGIQNIFADERSTWQLLYTNGGISVSILVKFWIAVVWYLFSLWSLTTVFTLILVKLM